MAGCGNIGVCPALLYGVERAVVCRDILRLPSLYSQVSRHDGTECQRRDGGGGQQEKENNMSNENSIHIFGM